LRGSPSSISFFRSSDVRTPRTLVPSDIT
jgi:hypothetical protein